MNFPEGRLRSIPLPRSSLIRPVGEPIVPGATPRTTERRRFQRVVMVHGPTVRMEIRRPDGTPLFGIVEDCCWSGAGVRFGYASDPNIRVGQIGVVLITSMRLPDLKLRALVTSAEPLLSGGTRYGLHFVDEDELRTQVRLGWRRWFSLRRSPRYEPRSDLAATVTVTWRGNEARGRVADVSLDGLAAHLDLESARSIVIAREVGLLLAFPGSGGTMRLRAKVRGAKQGAPTVRIGFEFEHDAMYESCKQRLESWTGRLSAKFGQVT